MVDNVQPGVRELLDNPSEMEGVSLIIGVEETPSETVIAQIEDTGATIEEELFYDNLAVAIDPDTDLRTLCNLDIVTSVEIEGKWEAMDEGNSNTPGLHPS